ncbi:MAG: lipid-A-disaccharide synthase [Halanaerobiales bacterium]|nr:lipid-A-disaccharide synthase [Halanaerobiales bacterium]
MVVAGEVSGDMQAARVIKALQQKEQDVTFIGMGGEEMRKAGVDICYDPTQFSTIGFVEALKHLRKFNRLIDMLSDIIDKEKPDLLFLVDYSGFNMKMAKIGHKKGIPIVNYFSPSAWVWGEWRARKMAKWGAKIAAVFPMEAEIYEKNDAEVTFVGHPLLDFVSSSLSHDEFRNLYGLKEDDLIIGLLPGSRRGEIISLLPSMLGAARRIVEKFPKAIFLMPLASPQFKEIIYSMGKDHIEDLPLIFTEGQSYEVMDNAELILVASGTATLEAACFGTPMVIAYQTSRSTYLLGRLMAKVQFAGLPNIIASKQIVPEFLQKEVTSTNLAQAAIEILENSSKMAEIKMELSRVRQLLGQTGAVERVADLIITTLKENEF